MKFHTEVVVTMHCGPRCLVTVFRGVHILCDAAVAVIACPYCKATVGEPCRNARKGYNRTAHAARRKAATRLNRKRAC